MSETNETKYGKLILNKPISPSGWDVYGQLQYTFIYIFIIVLVGNLILTSPNYPEAIKFMFYGLGPWFAFLAFRWLWRGLFSMFHKTILTQDALVVKSRTETRRLAWTQMESIKYKPSKQVIRIVGRDGKRFDISEKIEPLQDVIRFIAEQFHPEQQRLDKGGRKFPNVYRSAQRYIAFRNSFLLLVLVYSIDAWPFALLLFFPFFVAVRTVEFEGDALIIRYLRRKRFLRLDDVRDAPMELHHHWGIFRYTLMFRLDMYTHDFVDIPFSGKDLFPLYLRLKQISNISPPQSTETGTLTEHRTEKGD